MIQKLLSYSSCFISYSSFVTFSRQHLKHAQMWYYFILKGNEFQFQFIFSKDIYQFIKSHQRNNIHNALSHTEKLLLSINLFYIWSKITRHVRVIVSVKYHTNNTCPISKCLPQNANSNSYSSQGLSGNSSIVIAANNCNRKPTRFHPQLTSKMATYNKHRFDIIWSDC